MGVEELLPWECQQAIKRLREEAQANVRKWPEQLSRYPRTQWPVGFPAGVEACWRSRELIVQVWPGIPELQVIARLSIAGTSLDPTLEYSDTFTWEQLQAIKAHVGFGEYDAVEVYPSEGDVVNIANMRHLWVLRVPVPFAWRRR